MATGRGRASSGIGGSLILIIFIILTVTIFSVLTLVSAQNEIGTVKKTADISKKYYDAENTAAEKCGELKAAFSEITENSRIVSAAIELGGAASSDEKGVTVSFMTDIDENRVLETVLRAEQGELKLISSKIVSKNEGIDIDDTIDLWEF